MLCIDTYLCIDAHSDPRAPQGGAWAACAAAWALSWSTGAGVQWEGVEAGKMEGVDSQPVSGWGEE